MTAQGAVLAVSLLPGKIILLTTEPGARFWRWQGVAGGLVQLGWIDVRV